MGYDTTVIQVLVLVCCCIIGSKLSKPFQKPAVMDIQLAETQLPKQPLLPAGAARYGEDTSEEEDDDTERGVGVKEDGDFLRVENARERFERYKIKGTPREKRLNELIERYFGCYEGKPCCLWNILGPVEYLLLVITLSAVIFLNAFDPFGKANTRLWANRIYWALLSFVVFRMGYMITKYLGLALDLFHSDDDRVVDNDATHLSKLSPHGGESSGNRPDRHQRVMDALITGTWGSPQKESTVQKDKRESEGNGCCIRLDRSGCFCCRCKVPKVPGWCKKACNCMWRPLYGAWKFFFTFGVEFITILQLCEFVMAPYLSGVETSSTHAKVLRFLKSLNLNVQGKLGIDDIQLFWGFVIATFVGLIILGTSMALPFLLGEPWAISTLRLCRQALSIAEYEAQHIKCCGTTTSLDDDDDIPKRFIRCFICSWANMSMKCLNFFVTRLERNQQDTKRKWRRNFSYFVRKLADLAFIPLSVHVVGIAGINAHNCVIMYSGPGFKVEDDSFFRRMMVAFAVFPLWAILYTMIYCFEGVIQASTEDVNMGDEQNSKEGEIELRVHPQFLYKMHFIRVAIILIGSLAGQRKPFDNGGNNIITRCVVFLFSWWAVIAHADRTQGRKRCSLNLGYPSGYPWFNLWQRAALIFVALLATLVGMSGIYHGATHSHEISTAVFLWIASALAVTVLAVSGWIQWKQKIPFPLKKNILYSKDNTCRNEFELSCNGDDRYLCANRPERKI